MASHSLRIPSHPAHPQLAMIFGPNNPSVFNLTQPRYSALVVELACMKILGISSWPFTMETA